MRPIISLATSLLVLLAASTSRVEAFAATHLTATVPPELESWCGCDEAAWQSFPPGARRDLLRFAKNGNDQLASFRVATMREVLDFVYSDGGGAPGEPWEKEKWDKGVAAWEARNAAIVAAEKEKAKQEKKRKAAEARAAKEAAAE